MPDDGPPSVLSLDEFRRILLECLDEFGGQVKVTIIQRRLFMAAWLQTL